MSETEIKVQLAHQEEKLDIIIAGMTPLVTRVESLETWRTRVNTVLGVLAAVWVTTRTYVMGLLFGKGA